MMGDKNIPVLVSFENKKRMKEFSSYANLRDDY
jgi:hypothetical protein